KLLQSQRACEPQRRVALVHEGDEAVDLGELEPGVLDGSPDRDAGELELGVRRVSSLVVGGLADPGDGAASVHRPLSQRNRATTDEQGRTRRTRRLPRRLANIYMCPRPVVPDADTHAGEKTGRGG